jgi:hypothetical protein
VGERSGTASRKPALKAAAPAKPACGGLTPEAARPQGYKAAIWLGGRLLTAILCWRIVIGCYSHILSFIELKKTIRRSCLWHCLDVFAGHIQ